MADLHRQIGANLRQDLLYRGVIFCIIILVMGWILRRSIIDPVKQVAMSISRVTRTGSYSERLSRLTNDEIGTLIGSFNELMQELEQKHQQSSEADARYRSFIEMVPSAVVTCLQDGRIIVSNQRAEKLFGSSRKDLLGKSIFDFITGEAARNELFATRLKDGRIKLVTENSIQTVRDFRGRLIQMEAAVAASEGGDQQPLFTVILHGILTS
jgi:PAS domain S-box-containing protein